MPADLGNTEAIPAVVEAAVAEFGAVDILVNNAGIIRRSEASISAKPIGTP